MFRKPGGQRRQRVSARCAVVLIAASLGLAGASRADVYRWVDDNGAVHYGERTAAPRDAHRLDIHLDGNDPPEASLTCQTIRCQYERLRSDGERLRREQQEKDAAWEKELAERARKSEQVRQAEARKHAATASRQGSWVFPRRVLRRPRIQDQTPPEQPSPATDPGSPLRALPPDGLPVRPLR